MREDKGSLRYVMEFSPGSLLPFLPCPLQTLSLFMLLAALRYVRREGERERERVESHFLGGGKKGGKMDVAEVPLAEKNRFQPKGTSATWAIVMLRESKRFRYFPRSHWVILFPHLMTPNFEICEICQRIGVFECDIPCSMHDLVAWRACSEASRAAGSPSLPVRGWILGKQREEKKATLAVVPGRREGRERW